MGKDDIFLDQSVRADQYIDVPRCQLLQDLAALRCLRISGEVSDADRKSFVEMLECLIVLPCQDLGRCHECALISILYDLGERECRDSRLAAPDIPLHQTVHRDEPFHIVLDITKGLLLPLGQPEGELLAHPLDELTGWRALDALSPLFSLFTQEQDACLHEEQFFKCDPSARFSLLGPVLRIVHRTDGRKPSHQFLSPDGILRKILIRILHQRERSLDHTPKLRRLDALGQSVYRDELLKGRQVLWLDGLDLRIADLVPVVAILHLAICQHMLRTMKKIGFPRLIEIGEHHRARIIDDHDIQDRHASSGMDLLQAHHLSVDHSLFIRHEISHRRDLRPVLIAPRKIGKEIFYGMNTEALQLLLHPRADALQVLDGIR